MASWRGFSQWGLNRKRIRLMHPGKPGENPVGERWKAEWEAVPRRSYLPGQPWRPLERWEMQRGEFSRLHHLSLFKFGMPHLADHHKPW